MSHHLTDYIAVAVALHGVALAWVNMTPTPKDNEALDSYSKVFVKLYRVVEIIAGIISPLAKR